MKRHAPLVALLAALTVAVPTALSQPPAAGPVAAAPLSEGQIRKVDRARGTVVIRHGPIANLGMGAMTMEFKASDPAMLASVKPGDRVRFAAAMSGNQLAVTRIEPVR